MTSTVRLPLLALALVAACGSKITSNVDTDLQDKVETLEDCLPHLYPRVQSLLRVADTWRQKNPSIIVDPVGLTFVVDAEAGGTVVNVTYAVDGTTITMAIRFYSPAGAQQTLAISGFPTLDETIDEAATLLSTTFPGVDVDRFMVGDWLIAGGGLTGSGSLTGIIGGATNQNELEELRTTAPSSTVSGGPPAIAEGTITDVGPPLCQVEFTTSGLSTDELPTQQYPIGEATLTLNGPEATVTAVITFDGSATATIAVDGVPGTFAFNLNTRDLAYLP